MDETKTFKGSIQAKGMEIEVLSKGTDDDYISLTDIAKYKNSQYSSDVIQNWMRNRSTVEFLGLWEKLYNPNFNYLEFEVIDREAGRNGFVLTPKRWIESVNAIGMISKQGRYAAAYAHKDIAFKFAAWISVEFELYIIRDYQRLKNDENSRISLEWNVKRILSKVNYRMHVEKQKHRFDEKTGRWKEKMKNNQYLSILRKTNVKFVIASFYFPFRGQSTSGQATQFCGQFSSIQHIR